MMKRDQFIQLLQSPSTINLNLISELEDITQQFPYYQNAHLLLAKQYHGHENIRYENYLRKASAYCPDRTVLYRLIKSEPAAIIHMEAAPALSREVEMEMNQELKPDVDVLIAANATTKQGSEVSLEPENKPEEIIHKEDGFSFSEQVEELVEPESKSEEIIRKEDGLNFSEQVEKHFEPEENREEIESIPILQKTETDESLPTDPMEIIRKRLKEINSGNRLEDEKTEKEILVSGSPLDLIQTEEKENENTVHKLIEESSPESAEEIFVTPNIIEASSLSESITASTASFENIKEGTQAETELYSHESELKKPNDETIESISATRSESETIVEDAHSFIDWLKIKSVPVIPADHVSDYLNSTDGNEVHSFFKVARKPEDELLDKFISTQPRIVAQKSEFYSPGNMARKSAVEHEDLISETLARIYAQQGNIPKAIDAYRRLSLKIPEKSSYFAALIKELEEKEA